VNSFLSGFDRRAVSRLLPQVVEMKAQDAHLSESEVAGMWNVVHQAARD
jgi:hypothetical protein